MKDRRSILGMLGLLLVCAVPGVSQEATSEDQFLALERAWMAALSAHDSAGLEAMLAPAFTIIGAGSAADAPVGDRGEWLKNAARYPWPHHDVRLVKVHDLGDTAVVHCVLTATYPPKSITPEGGQLQFVATDVWVKRGPRWQVLSRHSSLAAKSDAAQQ
jgi:ketosteroid isomerase-like protein